MLNHPSGEELLAQGAPSDRTLATGKPPKRDDPGPVKLGLTDEQKKERREKREKAAIRDAKQEQAGAIAARELKAAQVAKQERIREHEWHLAIEETEVSVARRCRYRLDSRAPLSLVTR